MERKILTLVAKIDTIYEKFDLERNIRAESIDPDTFRKNRTRVLFTVML